MKKFTTIILTFFVCITCFITGNVALASTEPISYDSESEHFELLAVKDEDIRVESENLTFDFSNSSDSTIGQTTAVYDIRNARDTKTVAMGFPLVSTINTVNSYETVIKMGNDAIDYTKYYAFAEAKDIINYSFEEILEGLNELEKIDADINGYMYAISISDVSEAEMVQVNFDINNNESLLIYDNFSGCTSDEDLNETYRHMTLEAWTSLSGEVEGNTVLYMYVIGDDIRNFEVKQLSRDHEEGEAYDESVATITTVNVADYINTLCKDENRSEYDIIAAKLLEYISSAVGFIQKNEVINDIYNSPCVIFLGYNVILEGNNACNILSISYPIDGGLNAYYEPVLNTYNYISSPAKNWTSFGELTINIITNTNIPYVIKANLEYTKISENHYQYIGNGVITGNIQFALCAKEKPIDNSSDGFNIGTVFWTALAFYGIMGLCVTGLVVSATIIIIRKIKLKKSGEKCNGNDNTQGD